MIDHGQLKIANDILEALVASEMGEEHFDVEVLVNTLSGIINQNQARMDKAKDLSHKYGSWKERRKWLIIPEMVE